MAHITCKGGKRLKVKQNDSRINMASEIGSQSLKQPNSDQKYWKSFSLKANIEKEKNPLFEI